MTNKNPTILELLENSLDSLKSGKTWRYLIAVEQLQAAINQLKELPYINKPHDPTLSGGYMPLDEARRWLEKKQYYECGEQCWISKETEINGVCPDCGTETVNGKAAYGCNWSPCVCETCGSCPCDGSC